MKTPFQIGSRASGRALLVVLFVLSVILSAVAQIPKADAREKALTPAAAAKLRKAVSELQQPVESRNLSDTFSQLKVPPADVAEPKPPVSAVASAAVFPVTTTSSASPELGRLLTQAQRTKSLSEEASAWQAVEKEALRVNDRKLVAQAGLAQARAYEMAATVIGTAASSDHRQAAIGKYEEVLNTGVLPQPTLIRNNLAVLYLQQNDAAAARKVMSELDWGKVDPGSAYLCRYNFGRSEELSGDTSAALVQYRLAVKERATFRPPAEGAFRVLRRKQDFSGMASLANDLVAAGQARFVAEQLQSVAGEAVSPAAEIEIMTALAQAYAATGAAPAEFLEKTRPRLNEVAAKRSELRPLITELEAAYESSDDVAVLDTWLVEKKYPAWSQSEPQREALSMVLKSIGDFYQRSDGSAPTESRRALNAYSSAWSLDHSNTDAALYTAALLQGNKETLDPSGGILNALIERIFSVKVAGYQIPVKTTKDLVNLMRLHLVLAEIYEKDHHWGSEYEATSTIFQLAHAIAIEDQLRNLDPDFLPAPNLPNRLARAFVEKGDADKAYPFFLNSAQGFLAYGQRDRAQEAFASALSLTTAPSLSQKYGDKEALLKRELGTFHNAVK